MTDDNIPHPNTMVLVAFKDGKEIALTQHELEANYVKDNYGVTYCELPDVAIVNNVRFVWEDNKLYMEWEGCDDGEQVYFI